MPITPATRVSQTLHKGGLPTTEPGSRREGNKVRNACAPPRLANQRRFGQHVVSVSADFDIPSLRKERLENIVDILTAAGYRVEPHQTPDSSIAYVWEPNWRSYLDPRLAVQEPATETAPVAWRADKLRDGQVLIHAVGCPAEPPGKSIPVRGRTAEAVAAEVVGKLLPKTITASGAVRLVQLHECLPQTSTDTDED